MLSGFAANGLGPTLEDAGLGDLVGKSRLEVLGGLTDYIAGEGSQLDDAALRGAVVFVLDEYLPADLAITEPVVTQDVLETVLRLLCARYIFLQCNALLSARLAQLDDPAEQQRLENRAWTYVKDEVEFSLLELGVDVLTTDWMGEEGRAIMERILGEVLQRLEGLP